MKPNSICSEKDCNSISYANSKHCRSHDVYFRQRKGKKRKFNTKKGEGLKFLLWSLSQETDDCIIWPFNVRPDGYGNVRYEGKSWQVHRLALVLSKGAPAAHNLQAAHLPIICHNRACINKRHLDWKTPKQNAQDRTIDKKYCNNATLTSLLSNEVPHI